MTEYDKILKNFQILDTRYNFLKEDLLKKRKVLKSKKIEYEEYTKAKWIISEAMIMTQTQFKDKIESLITISLKSIFDREFSFRLEFNRKGSNFECKPVIVENGNEYDPREDIGGSMIEIIEFIFRIIFWSFQKNKSRPIMLLDEPTRGRLGKLTFLAGQMFKDISHELRIQIIMTTHDRRLISISDKSFLVEHDKIKSNITNINNIENIE